MTMLIKDITDTLSTISTYYKSHVGIDLEMEMSIDNNDVMAIDYAIKGLEELQAHRYAWAKLREDIRDEAEFAYADFDEYKYEVLGIDDVDDLPNDDYRYGMERALELIDICRPKEGNGE